jgi:hypothetical protein
MLSVIMLSVIMLSVFMLSVVILECLGTSKTLCFFRFLFEEISTKPQQRVVIDVFVQSQRKKKR